MEEELRKQLRLKLGRKFVVTDHGCWEWTAEHENGYGNVWFNGDRYKAHRAMWIAYVGEIPEGLVICHKCDNTNCVNPDHLFLGTQLDNIRDRHMKGRSRGPVGDRSPSRLYPERVPRGEKHPFAKLSKQDVIDIRSLYATGKYIQRELTEKFGISRSHIANLVRPSAGKRYWGEISDVQDVRRLRS